MNAVLVVFRSLIMISLVACGHRSISVDVRACVHGYAVVALLVKFRHVDMIHIRLGVNRRMMRATFDWAKISDPT